MAGRFVRASKYRHVFGKPTRKEFCYDNLHISRNAWDTNLIKANTGYLSVNWEASGGGCFAVIPLNERGKLPDQIPLFRGHTATVLDTDWHPFNDRVVASASDDGKVFIWQVPEDFTLYHDAEEVQDVAPVSKLTGHSRKVGQVLFNPAAENILASASGDLSIKLWDITANKASISLQHPDIVQSLSWSADGSLLVTSARDKKLRVWDVRQQRAVHEAAGHSGAKTTRVVWMGEQNRFATVGFSRMSERQLGLWEAGRTDPIDGFQTLDSISGVCMPFWDDGTNCLYIAGKGDGNIRYFEYQNDRFEFLSEYKSADPQRGVAFLPKRGVSLHDNEVMRAYKTVNDMYIEPISFTVPRRAETFQADIYPPATSSKPGVSAQEWLSGKTSLPPKVDLESVYEGNAPVEVAADYKPPAVSTPAPAPAAAAKAAPKKESEPASPAVIRSPPPSMGDQKQSISAMANKFQDDEEEEDDNDDAETSSFEEIGRPQPRAAAPAASVRTEAKPPSPIKPTPAPAKATSPIKSPAASGSIPKAAVSGSGSGAGAGLGSFSASTPSSGSGGGGGSVESSLDQIKQLLEAQMKIITKQSDQISNLTSEVDSLKKRIGAGASPDQSERIRQLELELEAARS